MKGARGPLYAHALVALACVGSAVYALGCRAESGWRFDRRLEVFFADPLVSWAYLACLLSCFAFPVTLAFRMVGRMSAWRWCPAVAASVVLGLVQYAALVVVYPVRY